jgi:hypothetical protein
MSVENMPDDRIIHYYENIRQQVEAERANKLINSWRTQRFVSMPIGCEARLSSDGYSIRRLNGRPRIHPRIISFLLSRVEMRRTAANFALRARSSCGRMALWDGNHDQLGSKGIDRVGNENANAQYD